MNIDKDQIRQDWKKVKSTAIFCLHMGVAIVIGVAVSWLVFLEIPGETNYLSETTIAFLTYGYYVLATIFVLIVGYQERDRWLYRYIEKGE